MAIRVIRTEEDPVLRKISKPVKEVTPKIITLIDDMLDTMYEIPKDDNIGEVILTKEYIEHSGGPRIIPRGQTVLQLETREL